MKLFLAGSFLFWSCASSARNLTTQEQHDCMKIFTEILNIQDKRNSFNDEMNVINWLRKEKKISKKKHRVFSIVWLKRENRLATKVNQLYIDGYARDCFKEIKGNESNMGVDE